MSQKLFLAFKTGTSVCVIWYYLWMWQKNMNKPLQIFVAHKLIIFCQFLQKDKHRTICGRCQCFMDCKWPFCCDFCQVGLALQKILHICWGLESEEESVNLRELFWCGDFLPGRLWTYFISTISSNRPFTRVYGTCSSFRNKYYSPHSGPSTFAIFLLCLHFRFALALPVDAKFY